MKKNETHICPWWIGSILASPIRRLFEKPEQILSPYIREGMTVLEIGPGMGFFSIPAAVLAGDSGRVICVDVQEKMLNGLRKRAKKSGLQDRIETRRCEGLSMKIEDLNDAVDFVFLFHVVHEVGDASNLFSEIYKSLKKNGKLFIAEPAHHVSEDDFRETVKKAQNTGFKILKRPVLKKSVSIVMIRE